MLARLLARWLALLALLHVYWVAGCAYIEPIPCEDLEWPSATGPRTYPHLCNSSRTTRTDTTAHEPPSTVEDRD